MPIVRYPGGNFVSGYNWLDGVGPKAQRPTVLDRAWNSLESNQFGTNEFIDWCALVGTEPLLGMNFGTGTVEMALAYVEYCNLERGTRWSDLRRVARLRAGRTTSATGASATRWTAPGRSGSCRRASTAARPATRPSRCACIDRNLQLIACGSSGTFMPTYLAWDREVLEECYDQVDGLSLHAYYGNTARLVGQQHRALPGDEPRHGSPHPRGRGRLRLRAGPAAVEQAAVAVVRRVERLVPRARRAGHRRPRAPPRRGCSKRSTTSRTRCSSAASSTRCCATRTACAWRASRSWSTSSRRSSPTNSGVLRQSTYYPYAWALRYARGRVLDLRVESETYPIKRRRAAGRLRAQRRRAVRRPRRDASTKPAGQAAVLMLNRDLDGEREVVLEWEDIVPTRVLSCETLTGPDLKAFNTFEEPRRVAPQPLAAAGGRQPDDVQAAAALVHRRPPEPQVLTGAGSPARPPSERRPRDRRPRCRGCRLTRWPCPPWRTPQQCPVTRLPRGSVRVAPLIAGSRWSERLRESAWRVHEVQIACTGVGRGRQPGRRVRAGRGRPDGQPEPGHQPGLRRRWQQRGAVHPRLHRVVQPRDVPGLAGGPFACNTPAPRAPGTSGGRPRRSPSCLPSSCSRGRTCSSREAEARWVRRFRLPMSPTPRPIDMSGTAGKVALANSTASLGCNGGSSPCSAAQLAHDRRPGGLRATPTSSRVRALRRLSKTTAGVRAASWLQRHRQQRHRLHGGSPPLPATPPRPLPSAPDRRLPVSQCRPSRRKSARPHRSS